MTSLNQPDVEQIHSKLGPLLAILIRSTHAPDSTAFVSAPEEDFQVGFVVYKAGEEIPRHCHRPISRQLKGACEVLVVRSGSVIADLYHEGDLMATRTLFKGDTLLILQGGHGFRMLEDTVLLEVKQGPYPGPDEKVRF